MLHIGPLHPVETLLVALLAFGPLVAAVVVVVIVRRREDAEDAEDAEAAEHAEHAASGTSDLVQRQGMSSGEGDSSAANVPPSS